MKHESDAEGTVGASDRSLRLSAGIKISPMRGTHGGKLHGTQIKSEKGRVKREK